MLMYIKVYSAFHRRYDIYGIYTPVKERKCCRYRNGSRCIIVPLKGKLMPPTASNASKKL